MQSIRDTGLRRVSKPGLYRSIKDSVDDGIIKDLGGRIAAKLEDPVFI
uniref:Uncharacterized protein n=1 Tax=Rhizobium meliloti TaxID=382 RepID=I2E208_RHIML|nr:short hypothetical protein [Sinorhizobium meliloti]